MKIKVTLQQEVEYDSEDCLTEPESYLHEDGLNANPRRIELTPSGFTPSCVHIKAKDLCVGDQMFLDQLHDDHGGVFTHYIGTIVDIAKTKSLPDKNTQG